MHGHYVLLHGNGKFLGSWWPVFLGGTFFQSVSDPFEYFVVAFSVKKQVQYSEKNGQNHRTFGPVTARKPCLMKLLRLHEQLKTQTLNCGAKRGLAVDGVTRAVSEWIMGPAYGCDVAGPRQRTHFLPDTVKGQAIQKRRSGVPRGPISSGFLGRFFWRDFGIAVWSVFGALRSKSPRKRD